jgi:hypothetical protein
VDRRYFEIEVAGSFWLGLDGMVLRRRAHNLVERADEDFGEFGVEAARLLF